ncbi:MAG: aminoglycoside phosphotransferase family protein [Candidatus Saccharibacteria bacterium]|nr:aminoglycoside phosphotransferase family protein [Candidatus Saccharibacteria bacterium]
MNESNYELLKSQIEERFGYKVGQIAYLGGGVNSNAYLANSEYVFKFGISKDSKKDYETQKIFSDFYYKQHFSNIITPNIKYYFSDDDLQIIGYKIIKGTFVDKTIYAKMDKTQQKKFVKDIAGFLKKLHSFDESSINLERIDMKRKMLKEVRLIKDSLWHSLNENAKSYINKFEEKLIRASAFDGKKCVCHMDFNPNHILIDDKMNFIGVIDWGDAAVACECAEFAYLLSDSDEEIGRDVGMEILNYYGDIDPEKAIEYSHIHRMEYPLTELVHGIQNNKEEAISFGKKIIEDRLSKGNW